MYLQVSSMQKAFLLTNVREVLEGYKQLHQKKDYGRLSALTQLLSHNKHFEMKTRFS